MSRLVVVSNRVAIPNEHGAGGLASGVMAALRDSGGIWFGWNGRVVATLADEVNTQTDGNVTYATLGLTQRDFTDYYSGFANRTLWPLFHFRPSLVDFTRSTYEAYVRVNAHFAERLAPLLRPGDLVWIHDYHLIPLGAALRRLGVLSRIGFFLHTPFPPSELLVTLPVHRELFEALLAYDLVGFQTESYLKAFREYIVGEANGEINERGVISIRGGRHSVRAGVFPIGIDVDRTAEQAAAAGELEPVRALKASIGSRALIIGVDRLDYSKGLPERFKAYAELLDKETSLRRSVILLQIAPPSRSEVPEYRRLRRQLERLAGSINGKLADADWSPIRYVNKTYRPDVLSGCYRHARVGLVTPLRDGMNLVAKEYVACQNPRDPGVLVLFRFAGAANDLRGALLVNPNDIEATARTLNAALDMSLGDRRLRWEESMAALRRQDVTAWRTRFIRALAQTSGSEEQDYSDVSLPRN
ncbi:alpha,alpha-trehalose-phosphate synthase (UDP-forming) [Dokdonella fugitiva]|nr:trehalose-6-phosphate synthase [Dokdonella fugitiva]